MLVQTDDQREAEIERRAQERIAAALHNLPDLVCDAVDRAMDRAVGKNAAAMEVVLRRMAADRELISGLADHLQIHYLRSWREWLGAKIWNFMLYGILGAVLAWLSFVQLFRIEKP